MEGHPHEGGHVTDGPHGRQIEPLADIRLWLGRKQASLTGLTIEGGQKHEGHPGRSQHPLPRATPRTVGIDQGRGHRDLALAHHVMVCIDCHSTRDWTKFAGPLVSCVSDQVSCLLLRDH